MAPTLIRALFALIAALALSAPARADTAIFAGGCFWCVESNFEHVPGVSDVVSGYTGGTLDNPTYDDVTSETTGHYESVQITFDPAKVSYAKLVDLFLHSTDVVDADGQFCDRGPSYRSAIFANGPDQTATAKAAVAQAATDLGQPVATPVLPARHFWPAEAYHQNYWRGTNIVWTRRGPKEQSSAYQFYRQACGRDDRVKALWGPKAAFVE